MRISGRSSEEIRKISFERNIIKYAEGSCFVKFGDTHVLCTASVENRVPLWIRNNGIGWITAEYNMIPRATEERTRRETGTGIQKGRNIEIQRLIGRSLRSVVDLKYLGIRQIIIDCDVLQADGSTRTAAITGGWIALYESLLWMQKRHMIVLNKVLKGHIAAISCGILKGIPILDLDYKEDSSVQVDMNFVMNDNKKFVEIQGTSEKEPFSQEDFLLLIKLASKGIQELINLQKLAIL